MALVNSTIFVVAGSGDTDSHMPICTLFLRALAHAEIFPEVRIVEVSTDVEIAKRSFFELPGLEVGGQSVRSIKGLLDYIHRRTGHKIFNVANERDRISDEFLCSWMVDVFSNYVRYIRYEYPDNFQLMNQLWVDQYADSSVTAVLEGIRAQNRIIYQSQQIGKIDPEEILVAVEKFILHVLKVKNDQRYIFGDLLSLTDIAFYSFLQPLLSSSVKEADGLRKRFPQLKGYLKEIEKHSKHSLAQTVKGKW